MRAKSSAWGWAADPGAGIVVTRRIPPAPAVIVWGSASPTTASVQTRVKVAQTCILYGVVEANGKLYMASRETKVTLGGCGG